MSPATGRTGTGERMIRLKYGNTNTYLIPARAGYMLVDTDYAGTLPALYRALKQNGVMVRDIGWVMATHYHPDHMGLIPDLMAQGVKLLLIDAQLGSVHFADRIFARDGLPFRPIDEARATVIRCADSRAFLCELGIAGEIVSTPSHSADSVSLILDSGDCFVGDMEPLSYLDAYPEKCPLRDDWDRILRHGAKRILYAHANETVLEGGAL